MLEQLKEQVLRANLALPAHGLVTFTWGNASGFDRASGLMVIKPSGVEYKDLKAADLVCLEVESGKVIEGSLRPSSDTPTHLALYRAFPQIGGVVHTHSRWATLFAQAARPIPALGTTHADYFYGEVPLTRPLQKEEVETEYELNTGLVIVEAFASRDPLHTPGALVVGHGPFTWGKDAAQAVYHAVVLEEVAKMAIFTRQVVREAAPAPKSVVEKHFMRKHGPGAYYGQKH